MAFNGYKGRCVGRLMHFLYPVSYQFDYWAKFGDGKIYWGFNGPCIATFDWEDDSDFPIIDFIEPKFKANYHNQFLLEKERIRKREAMSGREPWSKKAEEERERLEQEARREELKRLFGLAS